MKITEKDSARFDAFRLMSEEPNVCHLWTGGTAGGRGYKHGQFRLGSLMVRAHRFAYERAYGPIPAGQVCRHRCNNPLCVRPDHLVLGTQQENVDDKYTSLTMVLPDAPLTGPEHEFICAWIDDLGHTATDASEALGGMHLGTVKKGLRLGRKEREWAMATRDRKASSGPA
jgi:hypothetical protein